MGSFRFNIENLTCDELRMIDIAVTNLIMDQRQKHQSIADITPIKAKIGDAIANGKYVPDEKGGDANDESENRKPRFHEH